MLCNKLTIRSSKAKDAKSIHAVEKKAFGRSEEADLAETLIGSDTKTFSYVAECDDKIIGHVLLSEIKAPIKAIALAPLAVVPKYREMQIGTQLVRHAINKAKQDGYDCIFVLGDVLYYERFGFSSELASQFKSKWRSKHFMAIELRAGALKGKTGEIIYPPAFETAS